MRQNYRLALTLALGLVPLQALFADDPTPTGPFGFLPDSKTYTNNSPSVGSTGIIGYTAQDPVTLAFTGPTSPVITMSTNSFAHDLWVYNGSQLTLNGGDYTTTPATPGGSAHYIYALNSTSVSLSNQGYAQAVELFDSSNFYMDSGTVGQEYGNGSSGVGVIGTGTAHLSGGTIWGVGANNGGTIILSGANVYDALFCQNIGSSFSMTSGYVSELGVQLGAIGAINGGTLGSAASADGSSVTMTAGEVQGQIFAGSQNAVFNFNGGTAQSILAEVAGIVNLAGGTVTGGNPDTGGAYAGQGGTVNLNSGTVAGGIGVSDTGSLLVLNNVAVTGDAIAAAFSTFTMNAGSISGNLTATNSTLNLNGGTISGNLTVNGGTFNWTNTAINGSLAFQGYTSLTWNRSVGNAISLSNYANITLNGGALTGTLETHDFSSITVNGGSTSPINTYHSSEVGLTAGTIQAITLHDQSYASIASPGVVSGDITAHDSSEIIDGSGTTDGKIAVYDSSVAYLYDGTFHGLEAHNYASINWEGGALVGTNAIYLYDQSNLDMLGINLTATLTNPNAGGFSIYSLTGYTPAGAALPNYQLYVQNTGAAFSLSGADQNWSITAGGSWATPANWAANVVPNAPGSSVKFVDNTTVTNPSTLHVTLDGNYTLAYLTFNSANSYILDPGTAGSLTFSNSGQGTYISASSSQNQINVPLNIQENLELSVSRRSTSLTLAYGLNVPSGNTVYKTGSGMLILPYIRGGSLEVDSGTLQMAPNGTSAFASRVNGLAVYGGKLDLTNNTLLAHNTAPSDLFYAFNSGYITSSDAGPGQGVAYLSGGDYLTFHPGALFDGATVASTDLLLKTTYLGDANLDGKITAADYSVLDASFLLGGFDGYSTLATWVNGDFNYDGVIDYNDYAAIDAGLLAYRSNGSLAQEEIAQHAAEFGQPYLTALAADIAPVPEPASLALLLSGAALLASRPRKKSAFFSGVVSQT